MDRLLVASTGRDRKARAVDGESATAAGWWEGLDVVGNGFTGAGIAQEMRF
jgi:hypothetical protein